MDVDIRTASIDTGNEKHDARLRSAEFFAADSFSVITFRSTRIERRGNDAKIYGMLTMRGVTRPIVLEGGGAMLGDEVEVEISVEAVRQR